MSITAAPIVVGDEGAGRSEPSLRGAVDVAVVSAGAEDDVGAVVTSVAEGQPVAMAARMRSGGTFS